MMSRACATLSDLNISSYDSSSSEKDEKPKCKTGDFIGLCLIGKSSRHISDSDSDVSYDSFAIKTSCFERFFRENKKLNLELESASFEIATL
jgi:hypothetical protein